MFLRQALAVAAATLLAIPGWAAPNSLGTVENSTAATLHGANLASGTSVFSGDTIEVGPRGSAWIALDGGAQLMVSADSQVQLSKPSGAGPIQFDVERGRARFRASGKIPVEGLLADATIRPSGAGIAVGYIAMLSATRASIGAEKGDLLVTTAHDGASLTVHEGTAITVPIAPEPEPNGAPIAARRRSGAPIILLGAAIVITITIVALLLNRNERKRVSESIP